MIQDLEEQQMQSNDAIAKVTSSKHIHKHHNDQLNNNNNNNIRRKTDAILRSSVPVLSHDPGDESQNKAPKCLLSSKNRHSSSLATEKTLCGQEKLQSLCFWKYSPEQTRTWLKTECSPACGGSFYLLQRLHPHDGRSALTPS